MVYYGRCGAFSTSAPVHHLTLFCQHISSLRHSSMELCTIPWSALQTVINKETKKRSQSQTINNIPFDDVLRIRPAFVSDPSSTLSFSVLYLHLCPLSYFTWEDALGIKEDNVSPSTQGWQKIVIDKLNRAIFTIVGYAVNECFLFFTNTSKYNKWIMIWKFIFKIYSNRIVLEAKWCCVWMFDPN